MLLLEELSWGLARSGPAPPQLLVTVAGYQVREAACPQNTLCRGEGPAVTGAQPSPHHWGAAEGVPVSESFVVVVWRTQALNTVHAVLYVKGTVGTCRQAAVGLLGSHRGHAAHARHADTQRQRSPLWPRCLGLHHPYPRHGHHGQCARVQAWAALVCPHLHPHYPLCE